MSFQWSAAAAAGLMKRSSFGASEALNVVTRRSLDDGTSSPPEANPTALLQLGLIFLNVIAWLPLLIFLGYTLNTVLPVLAVVEDDAPPPAYEPVSLKEESGNEKLGVPRLAEEPIRPRTGPVSSNIKATLRLLYAEGGFRSLFKGLGCAFVSSLASGVVVGVVLSAMPFLPAFVSMLVGELATLQLSAAWVHVVISTRNSHCFWRRLPGFKAAFRATALPTVIASLAAYLTFAVAEPMYAAVGVTEDNAAELSASAPGTLLKVLSVPLVQLLITLFIAVPANVILYRCQASLLPESEQTIVPFDRAFQLESARDRGYASVAEAWKTFSGAAWKRLVALYVKVTAITVVTQFLVAVVVAAQIVLFTLLAQKEDN